MAAIELALYLVTGTALGAVYFALLLWTVRLHASQVTAIRIVPLYGLRFAVAIIGFWIAARQGAFPLMFTLLGFVAARFAVQRRMGPD